MFSHFRSRLSITLDLVCGVAPHPHSLYSPLFQRNLSVVKRPVIVALPKFSPSHHCSLCKKSKKKIITIYVWFWQYNFMSRMLSESNRSTKQKASRGWVWTLNNYTEDDEVRMRDLVSDARVKYCLYGREVGSEGTRHLQGYLYCFNAIAFSSVKKMLPRCHIERQRGTIAQAIEYCRKDGDVTFTLYI